MVHPALDPAAGTMEGGEEGGGGGRVEMRGSGLRMAAQM